MKSKGTSFELIEEISSLLRGQIDSEENAIEKCGTILSSYFKIAIAEAYRIVPIWAEIIYQRNVNEI